MTPGFGQWDYAAMGGDHTYLDCDVLMAINSETTKQDQQASAKSGKNWISKGFASTSSVFGLIVLIATVVSSSYAALYLVFPHLQPREKLGATIDKIEIGR